MENKLNCILLIDDDEPTNYFNNFIIEQSGCSNHVEIVDSGQKALEYLIASGQAGGNDGRYPYPDLILLDINMPAMNGWEFLEKYKGLEKHHMCKTILVMLSTSLFPRDIVKAEEIPEISSLENKTLTIEKLEEILQKHFTWDNVPPKTLCEDKKQAVHRSV